MPEVDHLAEIHQFLGTSTWYYWVLFLTRQTLDRNFEEGTAEPLCVKWKFAYDQLMTRTFRDFIKLPFGKSQFLVGTSSSKGPLSIAMLDYWSVTKYSVWPSGLEVFPLEHPYSSKAPDRQ